MRPAIAKLDRVLHGPDGVRRLPSQRALDRALAAVSPEELFWLCERRTRGPIYLLPTRELVRSLADWLEQLAGPRGTVLEVGAGDGFLAQSLIEARPSLRLSATDSGAWEEAAARMTPAERKRERHRAFGLPLGPNVERREALAAIRRKGPTVVLAAWLPPGILFEKLVRSPCHYVVEIGAGGGVSGQGEWGWRFAHDFPPPSLERLLRSRLDAGGARRTQLTVTYGRRHPEFFEEQVGRGDWLWQFRPR